METNLTFSLTDCPAAVKKGTKKLTRYTKELIKVGKYVKDSVGLAFEVTAETLMHWQDTFKCWIENGNKVPIPLGHAAADDPEKNQGWVREMFIKGDVLFGVLELTDPALALTTDVSIYVPHDFVDGSGHSYIQPITHVALCTNPVIPGLKDFQELSLSNDLGERIVDAKKLTKLLGLADDADEKAILAAMSKAIKPDKPATTLSHTEPANDILVKLVAENRNIKIDGLVKAGLITPATKTAIEEQYTDKKTLALTLAVSADDGFDFLVQILAENKAVSLKEKSGQQLFELSNTRSQTEQNPIARDIDKRRSDAGLDK